MSWFKPVTHGSHFGLPATAAATSAASHSSPCSARLVRWATNQQSAAHSCLRHAAAHVPHPLHHSHHYRHRLHHVQHHQSHIQPNHSSPPPVYTTTNTKGGSGKKVDEVYVLPYRTVQSATNSCIAFKLQPAKYIPLKASLMLKPPCAPHPTCVFGARPGGGHVNNMPCFARNKRLATAATQAPTTHSQRRRRRGNCTLAAIAPSPATGVVYDLASTTQRAGQVSCCDICPRGQRGAPK